MTSADGAVGRSRLSRGSPAACTHLFAGLAVTDFGAARLWYERLFGRPPDVLPTPREAVWHLTSEASVYVVADVARAGHGVLTLAVDGLDQHLADLASRGVAPEPGPNPPVSPPRATIQDPDGNRITIFDDPSRSG